jgi:hypothetical protein
VKLIDVSESIIMVIGFYKNGVIKKTTYKNLPKAFSFAIGDDIDSNH